MAGRSRKEQTSSQTSAPSSTLAPSSTPNNSVSTDEQTPVKIPPKSLYTKFLENKRFEEIQGASKDVVNASSIHKNDVELWLFQVPKNFDPSLINGMEIDLEEKFGTSEIGRCKLADTTFTLSHAPSREYSKLINIFPTKDSSYTLGKPFSRQINIAESVTIPQTNFQMPAKSRVPQLTDLDFRYKPFGTESTSDDPIDSVPISSMIKNTPKRKRSSIVMTPKTPKTPSSTSKKKRHPSAIPVTPIKSEKNHKRSEDSQTPNRKKKRKTFDGAKDNEPMQKKKKFNDSTESAQNSKAKTPNKSKSKSKKSRKSSVNHAN